MEQMIKAMELAANQYEIGKRSVVLMDGKMLIMGMNDKGKIEMDLIEPCQTIQLDKKVHEMKNESSKHVLHEANVSKENKQTIIFLENGICLIEKEKDDVRVHSYYAAITKLEQMTTL